MNKWSSDLQFDIKRYTQGPPSKALHLCQWAVTAKVITLCFSLHRPLSHFIFHATQCNYISLQLNPEQQRCLILIRQANRCAMGDISWSLRKSTTCRVHPLTPSLPHVAARSAKPILHNFRLILRVTIKVPCRKFILSTLWSKSCRGHYTHQWQAHWCRYCQMEAWGKYVGFYCLDPWLALSQLVLF